MNTYIYAYELHYNHDKNNNDKNSYETHIIIMTIIKRITEKHKTNIKMTIMTIIK